MGLSPRSAGGFVFSFMLDLGQGLSFKAESFQHVRKAERAWDVSIAALSSETCVVLCGF